MPLQHSAPATALIARLRRPIRRPGALALLADLLLVQIDLVLAAGVEIAQRQHDPDLHVRPAAHAGRVAKVSAAAEEAREEVERIVAAASAGSAAGFVLREALVAVLVVDLARFRLGEGFVGFGYLDEFLGCGFVFSE